MPDERVASEPVDEIGNLRRELDDLRRTMLVRADRRPVGSIEPTLRITPMTDTVLLQGQTLNRADYVALWEWVSSLNLIDTGVFGGGNGTTTFTVPDFRGRFVQGAGTLDTYTYNPGDKGGSTTRVITPANMASHTHQVGNHSADVGSDEVSHTHGFGTTGVGDHGFHRPSTAIGPGGSGAAWTTTFHQGAGAHAHSGGTGNASNSHGHYIFISSHSEVVVGQNVPFDLRSPYIALNWLLWV